jgi:hypothetical protein
MTGQTYNEGKYSTGYRRSDTGITTGLLKTESWKELAAGSFSILNSSNGTLTAQAPFSGYMEHKELERAA